ncbi:MAG: hypothetical protein E5V74_21125 [Mesorhizobium sp.]|nr:MAG: hypothetical protein E5V74_21125 [Mesorhizobium sp.]
MMIVRVDDRGPPLKVRPDLDCLPFKLELPGLRIMAIGRQGCVTDDSLKIGRQAVTESGGEGLILGHGPDRRSPTGNTGARSDKRGACTHEHRSPVHRALSNKFAGKIAAARE